MTVNVDSFCQPAEVIHLRMVKTANIFLRRTECIVIVECSLPFGFPEVDSGTSIISIKTLTNLKTGGPGFLLVMTQAINYYILSRVRYPLCK